MKDASEGKMIDEFVGLKLKMCSTKRNENICNQQNIIIVSW